MENRTAIDLAEKELRKIAKMTIDVADFFTKLLNRDAKPAPPEEPIPDPPKALTLGEVRAVLAEKSRNGHTSAIKALLEKHGGSKLSDVPPDRYPDLLKEAEELA